MTKIFDGASSSFFLTLVLAVDVAVVVVVVVVAGGGDESVDHGAYSTSGNHRLSLWTVRHWQTKNTMSQSMKLTMMKK